MTKNLERYIGMKKKTKKKNIKSESLHLPTFPFSFTFSLGNPWSNHTSIEDLLEQNEKESEKVDGSKGSNLESVWCNFSMKQWLFEMDFIQSPSRKCILK